MKSRCCLNYLGLVFVGIMCSVVFLLSACGMRPPTEEARKALENGDPWIKSNLQEGVIKITNFKKAGGTSRSMAGVKYYSMKVRAKIEYQKGAYGFPKDKTGEWRGEVNFRKVEDGWVVLNVAGFMYY